MPTVFSFSAFLAIGTGAALGAWLRWLLGLALNELWPTLPLGTLAANALGGFLIGLALGWFQLNTELPPALKLFIITGFLGGLTTFSTFSGEVTLRLMAGQWFAATLVGVSHLVLSLCMTWLGLCLMGIRRF